MIIPRKSIISACPKVRRKANYASLSASTTANKLRTAKSLQYGNMGIRQRILQTTGRDYVWKLHGAVSAVTDEYVCDAMTMTRVRWEYDTINLLYPFLITQT